MLNPHHKKIVALLKQNYPNPKFPMDYKTPIQLLVSVILSAQCTDERVNIVTKELFKKYKTTSDFSNATLETLEGEIKSTGFYHNKAKHIILAASMIEEKFNGKMPRTMEEMLALPGVARKTANVVLNELYGLNQGIVVDTHIIRVAPRLGLTSEKTAEKIERDLMNIIKQDDWGKISMQMKLHGQSICKPKPLCENCFLNKICPKII